MIRLTNDFHGTAAAVRPIPIDGSPYHRISRATVLRLRRTLCGMSDCGCGGEFGERRGYIRVVTQDYRRNYIVDIRGSHSAEES